MGNRSVVFLLGFLSFVLPGFGVVIAVNPVGGSELVTCGGVGAAPCASLQAALGCDLFLDGVEVQIAEGVILKGPQNRNLPPISKRSVTFSGSPGATIDGEGSTVFTTDPSLDVGDGPVFQSLSFLNATMVFGSCGGTVKNCLFAGQGTTCGVVFNGAVPEGVQAVGLTVQGGSFSGSCGISATNGALTLESFAFNNGIGSTTAVVLRGVVQFSASVLEVTRWSGTVLDASAAIGTFSWAGGHVSNCLDNVLMRFGAGGAASLSGMTFSTNFGSVSVSNKTSLTATSCGFHNGASAPYVLLSGGSAVLRNCTFSSHTGSPALSCSGAAPADPAQLVVSDAVFVGNQNVVLASVASVNAGCSFELGDTDFLKNSFPQVGCQGGSLSLDKTWAQFVECANCNWGGCLSDKSPHIGGFQIALLVLACVAVVVLGGALLRWLFLVGKRRFVRRLEYDNIQDSITDDL